MVTSLNTDRANIEQSDCKFEPASIFKMVADPKSFAPFPVSSSSHLRIFTDPTLVQCTHATLVHVTRVFAYIHMRVNDNDDVIHIGQCTLHSTTTIYKFTNTITFK